MNTVANKQVKGAAAAKAMRHCVKLAAESKRWDGQTLQVR